MLKAAPAGRPAVDQNTDHAAAAVPEEGGSPVDDRASGLDIVGIGRCEARL